jgi:hypothetical protein
MSGPSLSLSPTITSLYQILQPSPPSPDPDTDLATNLDHALRRAPDGIRDQLQELCHWLVCCKNLWPAAASDLHADAAEPFSLHRPNQSLHADPNYVKRRIDALLGDSDDVLVQDIASYVTASDDSHWQALLEQNHPATSIDPADYPRHWPRECIAWVIRTMDMRDAELWSANFEEMDLRFVSLRKADLYRAIFKDANMEGADLSEAIAEDATFLRTNLSGADLTGMMFGTDNHNLKDAIVDESTILEHIGFEDNSYQIAGVCRVCRACQIGAICQVGADKERIQIALRNDLLLPREMDHMVRDNLRLSFQQYDSETGSDYLSPFTDKDAPHSRAKISTRQTRAYKHLPVPEEEAGTPRWKTALCIYLLMAPAQFILLLRQ